MSAPANIEGAVRRLDAIPSGCAFHPRCPRAFARRRQERPEPVAVGPGHSAACWRVAEEPGA